MQAHSANNGSQANKTNVTPAPSADNTIQANQPNVLPVLGRHMYPSHEHTYPDLALGASATWQYGNGFDAWANVEADSRTTASTTDGALQANYSGTPSSYAIGNFRTADLDHFIFDGAADLTGLNSPNGNGDAYGSFGSQPVNGILTGHGFANAPVMNFGPPVVPAGNLTPLDRVTTRDNYHRCWWGTCSKSFKRKADLERHLNSVHLKARTYYCPVYACSKSFGLGRPYSRLDKLQEHTRLKHRN